MPSYRATTIWTLLSLLCLLSAYGCAPEPPEKPMPPLQTPVVKGIQWVVKQGKIMQQTMDDKGSVLKEREIALQGVNWFGMETPDRAPHGLWSGRSMKDFLEQIKSMGFSAIRLPLSPEAIRAGFETASWAHKEAKDGRALLEKLLQQAQDLGLSIILDFHTYDPKKHGGDLPGRPFGDNYTKADWLTDLQSLAKLGQRFTSVVGIDLCNEPHALDWKAWKALVLESGRAILSTNPNLLILVNGVGSLGDTGGFPVHWGENLTSAGPIEGLPANKVLFAPHAYGPDVYPFDYINDPTFPKNMPAIWEKHFGHLHTQGLGLLIGEFGGKYMAGSKDKIWQDAFVAWLKERKIRHFLYWSLNPNSGDTGGLLLDDWRSINEDKYKLLKPLLETP